MGAGVAPGGVRFRVWAPKPSRLDVVLEDNGGRNVALEPDGRGYFQGLIEGMRAGDRYRYRLDGGDAFPDPCSRFQPDGPHGASQVVDPRTYRWQHPSPHDLQLAGQVIYELHIGTFTPEGTYQSAIRELAELKRLGVTMIEIMPLAEFSGRWGWGYDGVDLFAPFHHYGRPDDLRRLIDEAHGAGLAVILDVVYNHLGPDGNYLTKFTDTFFSTREETDWGQRINYDGPGSAGVREMMVQNACYWLTEYRFDGLRLDATMEIHDQSPVHLLAELSQTARAVAGRPVVMIGESEPQDVQLVAPTDRGGWGLDGLWSDDFHHTCRVALTGQRGAYYHDYTGSSQEILSCIKRGPLFQGQRYDWQDQPRGWTVRKEPAQSFVFYLQNHDQVANQLTGQRLHELCHPGSYRALTALLLLAPETPLIFMGEEFAASAPFLYFSDHGPELQAAVDSGRIDFLYQFPNMKHLEAQRAVPPPGSRETFERSKIDSTERKKHSAVYQLYRDLLRLRRRDPVVARQDRFGLDGAVLSPEAFVIRFFGEQDDDRLLIVNLGRDLELIPAPEPLLAPVDRGEWRMLWSSESIRYGGLGMAQPYLRDGWHIQGTSAMFLRARPGKHP